MAPALTEPLSPKEKLSTSAATASPTTRASKKLETSALTASTSSSGPASKLVVTRKSGTALSTSLPSDSKKEQRVSTSISKRVIRSKDSTNIQQPNQTCKTATTCSASGVTSSSALGNRLYNNITKVTSNEQMGLSAARNSKNSPKALNNNELNIATKLDNKKSTPLTTASPTSLSNNCKDNSTEQLLADLTNDFEEAITAEICLRNKLPEVTLSKESNTETVSKTQTVGVDTALAAAQHMESELLEESEKKVVTAALLNRSKQIDSLNNVIGNSAVSAGEDAIATTSKQSQQSTCAHLVDGELPSIGTDSTMTASEIDDNLEERLSQLDGNAVAACVALNEKPLTIVDESVTIIDELAVHAVDNTLPLHTSTTPRLPAGVDVAMQPCHDESIMSPSASISGLDQQQQVVNFTPQSTTSTLSSVNLPHNFLKDGGAGAEELGDQDFEEMLKAFKGLDGVPNATDALCDLNSLFHEVFTQVSNYEDINSQPTSTPQMKPSPTNENHAAIKVRQVQLKDYIDMLLLRMRKLQVRHMCKQASTEIAGLFEWSARISSKACHPLRSAQMSEQDTSIMAVVAGRPPTLHWQEQKQNPLPMAQMSTTLRHLETAANEQQIIKGVSSLYSSGSYSATLLQTKRVRKQQTHQDSQVALAVTSATATSVSSEHKGDVLIPTYDNYVASELTHVSGMLHSEMSEVQNAIDSDATESSSGGESADEMVSYNNQSQKSLSICKRAVWRYSRDRAAIALRWSWLLMQINDLELKIRQHNDLHAELNRSKGEIVLESASRATKLVDNNTINLVNGYRNNSFNDSEVEQLGCSRTRALVLGEFRKRKLFQTTNMHTISKKAARPCNIKCGCQWPLQPCSLCTGRADPTAPRELPDTLLSAQRVALLDPGFHPVLSFPQDISQSIHFESVMRQPDWQHRVMRCQSKAIVKSVWKAEREAAAAAAGSRRHGETKRRYIRRKERNNMTSTTNHDDKQFPSKSGADGRLATIGIMGSIVANGTASSPTSSATTTPTTPIVANSTTKKRQRRNHRNNRATVLTLEQSAAVHQQPIMISSSNNNKTLAISNNSSNYSNNKKINHQYNKHNGQLSNTNVDQRWHTTSASSRGRNTSPTRGSNHGQGSHERSERRRRVSYDIDNIVIPFSVAAATRVELLPHKEIPTPKWRVVGDSGQGSVEITSSSGFTESAELNGSEVGAANAANLIKCQISIKKKKTHKKKPFSKTMLGAATPKANRQVNVHEKRDGNEAKREQNIKVKSEDNQPNIDKTAPNFGAVMLEKNQVEGNREKGKANVRKSISDIKISNGLQAKTSKAKESVIENGKLNTEVTLTTSNTDGDSKAHIAALSAGENKELTLTKDTKTNKKVNGNNENNHIRSNDTPGRKRLRLENGSAKEKDRVMVNADNEQSDYHRTTNGLNQPTTNGVRSASPPQEKGYEDISDEAFIARHQLALLEERRKFATFLKFPWSTRSRANRRVDSRAESSGANTPDPASPAPHVAGLAVSENESIHSPLVQTLLQNPMDALNVELGAGQTQQRHERRRTTSSRLRDNDRRSFTPERYEYVKPYSPLQFPLSDEFYNKMLDDMKKPAPRPVFQFDGSNIMRETATLPGVGHRHNGASPRGGSSKSISDGFKTGVSVNRRRYRKNNQNSSNGCVDGPKCGVEQIRDGRTANESDDVDDYGDDVYSMVGELSTVDLDDDDYPKHHLAPLDDDNAFFDGNSHHTNGAAANGLIDSDIDEVDDPFMDDDPNDPEWKRSLGERSENRMRKRL